MYLSGQVLGLSYLSYIPQPIIPNTFDMITLYGEQTVKYIVNKNIIMTDAELDAITLAYIPTWDLDTSFLATFDSTLDSTNMSGVTGTITNWNIQRTEVGSSIATDLGTVDASIINYVNYTAQNNKTYQYSVFPLTSSNQTGGASVSNSILCDWWNWSITDSISNLTFLFKLDFQSGELVNEIDRTEMPNFTRLNKEQRGLRDFIRGTISCTFGDVISGGVLVYSIDLMEQLRAMINDGSSIKIIKSSFGDIWYCSCYETKRKYNDPTIEQISNYSFSFMEIADSL